MKKLGHSKFESLSCINYYILILIIFFTVACAQGFPELNPSKETSTVSGKEWKPRTGEYSEFFRTEELAGVPSELEDVIKELTLSQLVDVALVNNPTTLQAWEHAKAAAAAWAVARGIYYPQIGGSAAYAYSKSGGSTQGLNQFQEQYGQVGATLNYLLLDFGGRSAQSEAARQALFSANWNHNQAIQDVWNAYYNFRTAAQQLEASGVLVASAKESYDASLTRFRSGVGDIVELLNAQTLLAEARAEMVQSRTNTFTSYAELVHAIGAELPSINNGNSITEPESTSGAENEEHLSQVNSP